jgi:polyhydroxyalkanoate synthesis regulator phasin
MAKADLNAQTEKLMDSVNSAWMSVKKATDERFGQVVGELKKRGYYDEDKGKKLIKDMANETEKLVQRTSKDVRLLMQKLVEASPVMTKEEMLKSFVTKADLKALEQRLKGKKKDD